MMHELSDATHASATLREGQQYRIAVDAGGTFTDVIAASGAGEIVEAKVPSDSERPELAIEAGLQELARGLKCRSVEALLAETQMIIQGTTVVLNTLLQRAGAKTGLLCTAGFRDTLEMRLGYKEERYLFGYSPPEPLVQRELRIPIGERVDKDGRTQIPLDPEEIATAARQLAAEGVSAVAICFLWSFREGGHERMAAKIVQDIIPDAFVTQSVDVLPRMREYNRTSTTVLNAYVGPTVQRYVGQTEAHLRGLGFTGRIRYVQSNGGLAESGEIRQRPIALLLSGPAAAPAAGLFFGALAGDNILTIDVGGTSFDACLVHGGRPDMRDVTDVERYRVATPRIDVHAVGAGGGSVASLTDGLLEVGPESAQAHPGPACYRRGGKRPTVTDAHVAVGLLNQTALLGGRFEIDASLARESVRREIAEPGDTSVDDAAVGILEVVSRSMADAMREITVRRGRDPRDYTLVAGGGAGGLHAAKLAGELGIGRVVIPKVAGTFCAFGALVADVRHDYTQSYLQQVNEVDFMSLERAIHSLEQEGRRALEQEGIEESGMRFFRSLDLRYRDQAYECTIDIDNVDLTNSRDAVSRLLDERFHRRHEELYEYSQPGYPCELVTLTVTAVGQAGRLAAGSQDGDQTDATKATPHDRREVRFARAVAPISARIFKPATDVIDSAIAGPAIIEESHTTIVVPPGWTASLSSGGQAYVLSPRNGGQNSE